MIGFTTKRSAFFGGFASLSISLVSGCTNPDYPDLPLQERGTYVDYYAQDGVHVCRGTVLAIDRIVHATLEGDRARKPSRKFRYYFFPQAQDGTSENICDQDNTHACYIFDAKSGEPGHIRSPDLINLHELAHATQHIALNRRVSPFFSEAFAFAMDWSPLIFTEENQTLDLRDPVDAIDRIALAAARPSTITHDFEIDVVGRVWAAAMVEQYGPRAYWEFATKFDAMASGDKSVETFRQLYFEVFGSDPADDFALRNDLAMRYHSDLESTAFAMCAASWPTIRYEGKILSIPIPSDCADEETAGFIDAMGNKRLQWTFRVDFSATAGEVAHLILASSPRDTIVSIQSCDELAPAVRFRSDGGIVDYVLRPSLWTITLQMELPSGRAAPQLTLEPP